MAGRLRGRVTGAPSHLAPVRAAPGHADLAAHDAGAGARRAGHHRAPPGRRQRPHRLEPRVDHQLLRPSARGRSRPRASRGAARAVDDAESVRRSPAVPDRRQLRRRGGDGGDAGAEPGRGAGAAAGAARGVAAGERHRASRPRRARARSRLERPQGDSSPAAAIGRGRARHPAAPRTAHRRDRVRRRCDAGFRGRSDGPRAPDRRPRVQHALRSA